jgi:hypothetical protein
MCGCGKKGVVRRAPTLGRAGVSPSIGPKSIASAGPTPGELRALGLQKSVSLTDSRSMDAQRRRVEKLRRDAIKNKLGK